MEMLDIQSVTYKSFFQKLPSFVALDISKSSTGWVKWLNDEVTYGTFSIQAGENDGVAQRQEFRDFLKELFGSDHFEYLFIEDIIGSVNFKTARTLYQLNPIADDLIADGVIFARTIIRESNKVWKKNLKLASGYKSRIKANSNDKQMTRDSLYLLGFGDKTTDVIAEDIYDAVGMSVGIIHRKFVLGDKTSGRRLRTDISKGYKVEQYEDLYDALDRANDLGGDILMVDFSNISRDLKFNFKRFVTELDDDTKLFVITVPTAKIGILALDKDFDLDLPTSYLTVYR